MNTYYDIKDSDYFLFTCQDKLDGVYLNRISQNKNSYKLLSINYHVYYILIF